MTDTIGEEGKPVLQHKYSMDATLERSIPVVEPEVEVGQTVAFELEDTSG